MRLENFCAEVQLLVNFSQTEFSQKLSIPKLHSWCMWNPWLIHHIFNIIIIFFTFAVPELAEKRRFAGVGV